MAAAVAEMRRVQVDPALKALIIEAPNGCGKSEMLAAMQADCVSKGRECRMITPRTADDASLAAARRADVVLIDDLDAFPGPLRSQLFERRHRAGATAIAAASYTPRERTALGPEDATVVIPRFEDRPEDALVLATLAWRDHVRDERRFAGCISRELASALERGPWLDGGRSVRSTVREIAGAYAEARAQGRLTVDLTEGLAAILAVAREDAAKLPSLSLRHAVVVEGRSDASHLRTASRVAEDAWQTSLLDDLDVIPSRGAEAAVRDVLRFEARGARVVGLLDHDESGLNAHRGAQRFDVPMLTLRWEFDPLAQPLAKAEVVIEDLLPVELVDRFFATTSRTPLRTVESRGRRRTVVESADKEPLAEWTAQNARFDELERIVWTICYLREELGLPVPPQAPPLDDWKQALVR